MRESVFRCSKSNCLMLFRLFPAKERTKVERHGCSVILKFQHFTECFFEFPFTNGLNNRIATVLREYNQCQVDKIASTATVPPALSTIHRHYPQRQLTKNECTDFDHEIFGIFCKLAPGLRFSSIWYLYRIFEEVILRCSLKAFLDASLCRNSSVLFVLQ